MTSSAMLRWCMIVDAHVTPFWCSSNRLGFLRGDCLHLGYCMDNIAWVVIFQGLSISEQCGDFITFSYSKGNLRYRYLLTLVISRSIFSKLLKQPPACYRPCRSRSVLGA